MALASNGPCLQAILLHPGRQALVPDARFVKALLDDAFDMPDMLPGRTAKLQPNGWIVAVFRGRWWNLGSDETRISGGRRTLVDNSGMLSNRIHTHEVAGSSPAPPTSSGGEAPLRRLNPFSPRPLGGEGVG